MKTREEIESDQEARVPTIALSTTVGRAKGTLPGRKGIPEGIGNENEAIDKVLAGSHTKVIYNSLKSEAAKILAQLRTVASSGTLSPGTSFGFDSGSSSAAGA